jgi:2',3'-cyclic-nucleotide 2'-phosphodiesterase (5'-nucleotidase family)
MVWVTSNVRLGDAPVIGVETHVREHDGVKIGFLGFAELDWFKYINNFFLGSEAVYEDYVESANRLIPGLKE